MVYVLTKMLENCYDEKQEVDCELGNLTNNIYIELIETLLKAYIFSFEEYSSG